jgi:hypothetical protein
MLVTVSLDSPSYEVTLFDPVSVVYRDATRQAKGYTVWSTLEPLREDLRTWAGVIQVGSATLHVGSHLITPSPRAYIPDEHG